MVKDALDNPEVRQAIEDYEDNVGYVDTGKDLYFALMRYQGGAAEASAFLNSIGIPGTKYIDEAAIDKGKSGSNFVLFDDSQVSIEARYPYQEAIAEVRYSRKGKAKPTISKKNGANVIDIPSGSKIARGVFVASHLKSLNTSDLYDSDPLLSKLAFLRRES
ncbi:MAG: hypothetical protein A4E66_00853 [Syntrophus sp. PtaB.Bin001]|nr:MAG: hypothetical protein A4E66_00853 [Syntrophus sp. PtaB.Bin001]